MTTENALVGGRYRLDQPIGRGRAGIVWQAYDTRLHRTVAAKRLYVPSSPDPVRTESVIATALQQANDSVRLIHDGAVTPREVLRDGSHVWAVMEYIPSRRMTEFLVEHGKLTAEQAASLGAPVASALAAAHASGLVHRSVEPGNILLADDGGVKITDVGVVGAGPDRAYSAPETLTGAPTAASDVFSLGATLYTAVEGEPPFGTDGQADARPSTNAGALSGPLQQLLAIDPLARPSMADVAAALAAIAEGRPTPPLPAASRVIDAAPPAAATVATPMPIAVPMPTASEATTVVGLPVQQGSMDQPTQRTHPVAPPAPGHQPTYQPLPQHTPHQGMPQPATQHLAAQQPLAQQPLGQPEPGDTAIKTDRSSLIRAWTFVVVAVLVAAGFGILFTELFLL